jgi:hypothetical protein
VWTHECQHDPPSLRPRLLADQATPKCKKRNHETLERKSVCPLDFIEAISAYWLVFGVAIVAVVAGLLYAVYSQRQL